jgi:hypothetical protein
MSENATIPVAATEPAPLPELTAEKLNIRNIQYNFYLLHLQQEQTQQNQVNLSQHLMIKAH